MRAVGCFIEYEDKILVLHRNPDRPEGNKWGIVFGKVEKGETDKQAILREIKEETGYMPLDNELKFIGYINTHATFKIILKKPFSVRLKTDEHNDFKWITPKEFNLMDRVSGANTFLKEAGYL